MELNWVTLVVGYFVASDVFNRIRKSIFKQNYGPIRTTITLVIVAGIFCLGFAVVRKLDQSAKVFAPHVGDSAVPSATPSPTPTPTPTPDRNHTKTGRGRCSRHSVNEGAQPLGTQTGSSDGGEVAASAQPQKMVPRDGGDGGTGAARSSKENSSAEEQKRHN